MSYYISSSQDSGKWFLKLQGRKFIADRRSNLRGSSRCLLSSHGLNGFQCHVGSGMPQLWHCDPRAQPTPMWPPWHHTCLWHDMRDRPVHLHGCPTAAHASPQLASCCSFWLQACSSSRPRHKHLVHHLRGQSTGHRHLLIIHHPSSVVQQPSAAGLQCAAQNDGPAQQEA